MSGQNEKLNLPELRHLDWQFVKIRRRWPALSVHAITLAERKRMARRRIRLCCFNAGKIVQFHCWEDCAVSLLGRLCSFNAGKILQFQCWDDCAVSVQGRLCSNNYAGKILQFQCCEDCAVSMLGRLCSFNAGKIV